jgi:hypothetical protein
VWFSPAYKIQTLFFLLSAHNFETAFLAADDGVEETYNPCSLFPITTVKWRFKDDIIYNRYYLSIYIIQISQWRGRAIH